MPRGQKKDQFTDEQLTYLGAVFDVRYGLGGLSPNTAVNVWSATKENGYALEYTKLMAETYGGTSGMTASAKGKALYHWTLPLDRRLELFKLLDESDKIRSLDLVQRELHQKRLERAINPEGLDTADTA
jgi:hypothetical protein